MTRGLVFVAGVVAGALATWVLVQSDDRPRSETWSPYDNGDPDD